MPSFPWLGRSDSFVIFDTEFTAWEGSWQRGWDRPGEYKEIVQIGALIADAATLEEQSSFLVFVKPIKNPILSEYLIALTGITQASVDEEGLSLEAALQQFRVWMGERHAYSFGGDEEVINENCQLIGIASPLARERFHDVREVFKATGMNVDDLSSGTITRAFGKEPERRAHNALSDARTILDGLRELRSLTGQK